MSAKLGLDGRGFRLTIMIWRSRNVMKIQDFAGYFQGIFREFHGASGFFQGVLPYALSGHALCTLSRNDYRINSFRARNLYL